MTWIYCYSFIYEVTSVWICRCYQWLRSGDVEWLTVNDVGWECLRLVYSSLLHQYPIALYRQRCTVTLVLSACSGRVLGRRASAIPHAASVTSCNPSPCQSALSVSLRHYRVGQIKRGQCSFLRRIKRRFRTFWQFLAVEIIVHLRTLRSIKIKYFSP